MTPLFNFKMSAQDADAGRALVRHLQKMAAYQQLAMEIYNDALRAATGGTTPPANEGVTRSSVEMSEPSAVMEHVLPALRKKIDILRKMENEHGLIPQPKQRVLRDAYDDCSQWLAVMLERAHLQSESFTAWIEEREPEVEGTRLDGREERVMDQAIASLNELIRKVGLDPEAWLDLNCEAHNAVRKTVGLGPMNAQEFRNMYFGSLAGAPTRFFG